MVLFRESELFLFDVGGWFFFLVVKCLVWFGFGLRFVGVFFYLGLVFGFRAY